MADDLYLDFEARSEVSIKEVGAWVYAEHPTTELLCCGWVLGETDDIKLWLPGDPQPAEWFHAGTWVAQNKDTELCLLRRFFGLSPKDWIDTATLTSAAGMPRNLHDVAISLHLDIEKLPRTALLALARPRKLSKNNQNKWWTQEEKPDLYADLYTYCKRDVELMRHVRRRLPPQKYILPPREVRLGEVTDRMNQRGVEVDLEGIAIAQKVVDEHTAVLRAEFEALVPGVNPRSPVKVAESLGMSSARKDEVREALKFADGGRHRALTILKTLKTASTSKLEAFQNRTTRDGRLHGAMVFHGAGRTGRWSSMGVQLQNLVRGLGASTPDWPAIDTSDEANDRAFAALHAGVFDMLYENPTRAIGSMMGGFILDSEMGLLSGDYAQIEARVLVAWAMQLNMVEAFIQGRDVYKLMASEIYRKPVTVINSDERFMGKRGVLGAGYGIGKYGFQRNLKMDFDIDISLDEADFVVQAYRRANPKVVALWWAVERLVQQCVLEKWTTLKVSPEVPRIAVAMIRDWLVIRLPSGRFLWYFEPELVPSDGKMELHYWGRDITKGGRWARVKTYGGKLVENCTQAMARDVMGDGLINLEDAGYEPLLSVHDEAVAPGTEDQLPEFKRVMKTPPKWWPDLPLDVDVQWTRRYTK